MVPTGPDSASTTPEKACNPSASAELTGVAVTIGPSSPVKDVVLARSCVPRKVRERVAKLVLCSLPGAAGHALKSPTSAPNSGKATWRKVRGFLREGGSGGGGYITQCSLILPTTP